METHREWVVYSTAIEDRVLMLECANTGAFGIVRRPTKKEWAAAFYAPSHPYRWTGGDARVEIISTRDDLEPQHISKHDVPF